MTDISKRALWCGVSVLALTAAFSSGTAAGALPSHGHFVSGQGSIGKAGQSLTVKQSSTTGIIDWNSFSIGKKSGVAFDNGHGATLNRVTGGNLSVIAGQLHASGSLYLMNSAGVIVSGTGRIVTGGNFVASTGNIGGAAFSDNHLKAGAGGIVNRGSITTGGSASLIGHNVSNTGGIRASAVDLTATRNLSIGGNVQAQKADGTGGTVTARAHTIVIGADGSIDASGQTGGTISAIASGTTTVAGTLRAGGASVGGFIETSGEHVHVADSALISALATNGKTGTWLIDPKNFTIAASGGDITGATLSSQLASANVLIQSNSGGQSGKGDIFVDDNVSWSSGHTLTLDAYRNIVFNASVALSGAGGLSLIDADRTQTSGTVGGNDGNSADGDLIFNTGGNVAFTDVVSGNTQGSLAINGDSYTLVNNVKQLAADILGNSSGDFALAGNYDATVDGVYKSSPIKAVFQGTFEGLGNSIGDLRIADNAGGNIGLFGETDGATLRDVALNNVTVAALNNLDSNNIGGLVGLANNTNINHVSVSGTMIIGSAATGDGPAVGGVAGDWTLTGASTDVSSDVSIDAGANARAGSLAGLISGPGGIALTDSHAGGNVIVGVGGEAGGFAATISSITVTHSYASGMVSVAGAGNAGGFAGAALSGTFSYDYATGAVFLGQGANGDAGGFVGSTNANIDHAWASGNVQTAGAQNFNEIISGGFAGVASGTITDSFATGNVASGNTSDNMIQGGFVGFMASGSISNSYATGTVTGNALGAGAGSELYGGFAGYIRGTILKSYETGAVSVSGPAKVGGFVGQSDSTATVDESYEFGKVTVDATATAGGFAGDNENTSGIGASVADYYNKTANKIGGVGHDIAPTDSDVGGISAANMFKKSSYHGWSFGTSTHGTGWVLVDTDGTFNNAAGAAGGTLPMLLGEYSRSIASAHQLELIGLNPSADYTLANTIDASRTSGGDIWGASGFVHIGSFNDQYAGTFNGAGYAVVGLTQKNTADAFGGMFYGLTGSAVVENFGLVDVSIDNSSIGGGSDGAIVAGFSGGALIDDYTTGKVMAGGSGFSGGLVGANDGTISHSWSSATISGTGGTADGGLAGVNNGEITTSYATGNVTVTLGGSSFAGGLVGLNNGGTIDTSYSSGTVKGAAGTTVGGFAGKNTGSIGISFFNSSNNGSTPGVGSGSHSGVSARTTVELGRKHDFTGWTFGRLGSGADWVIVDQDGSLNNAGGATGGTSPMLLSEYSNTISNAHQLQLMELDPTANYVLTNSIDASGTSGGDVWKKSGFVAVGGNNAAGDFTGGFDGAGYTISGLTIDDGTNDYAGLFGLTDASSVISDVTLTEVSVKSTASIGTGGLVGANQGTLSGVSVAGAVSGSGDKTDAASVGGVAGYNDGLIRDSQSYATVAATHDGNGAGAGGLVGFATVGSDIENSSAAGAVSMEGDLVGAGGLVGINGGIISQSFASGAVTLRDPTQNAGNSAGGLVGDNDAGVISQSYALGNVLTSGGAPGATAAGGFAGGNNGRISQSFSLGSVTAPQAGGFVGLEDTTDGGVIVNSYWDTSTSGLAAGIGETVGGATSGLTGKTTRQLEAALPSGFSSATWSDVVGTSLPYLNWQFASGSPQVVSGVLNSGIGGAGVANSVVSLLQNGANLDSVLTGGSVVTYANGFYYFLLAPDAINASSNPGLLVYDKALHAAVFDDQASSSVAGLDLTKDYLRKISSQAELSEINHDLAKAVNGNAAVGVLLGATPNLEIDDSGSLDIDRAIDVAGRTVVINAADGAVDQSAAITAAKLLLEGDANFTLNKKSNTISTLAMTGTGSLSLTDKRSLVIGKIDGVSGVDAGGSVVLTTRTGGIAIKQLLEAHDHDLTLKSAGGIRESRAGDIKAASLSGSSHGVVALNSHANDIRDLAGFVTGGNNFSLVDDHDLTIAGKVGAGAGELKLTAVGAGHGIAIGGKLVGGTVDLASAGSISEKSSGVIDATKLKGYAKGPVKLANAGNAVAVLGSFTTGGKVFSLVDDHALNVSGDVNAGNAKLRLTTVGKNKDLTIGGTLKGGVVSLTTTGAVTEKHNASIVASRLLNVVAETGITLTSKKNAIKKVGKDKTVSGPNKITL